MLTVLVIDDDDLILEMVAYALAPFHDSVEIKSVGDIELIDSNDNVDIVLCDLRLPKTTGEQTIKMLRQRFETKNLIIMSGAEPRDMGQWKSTYNISHFILKDHLLEQLPKMILKK